MAEVKQHMFVLDEAEMPTRWYNLIPDPPAPPAPPLHPATDSYVPSEYLVSSACAEALLQFAKAGEMPDVVVGRTGGGSNFGGQAFPFLREKLAGRIAPVIRV